MVRTSSKKRRILFWIPILLLLVPTLTQLPSVASSSDEVTIAVINPETGDNNFIYNITTASSGDHFIANITAANVISIDTWQVNIAFNPELLHCFSIFLPSDHIFAGGTVVQPDVTIDNVSGFVIWGATLFGGTPFTGNGRICQIEFNITKEPPKGGMLSCPIHIDTESTFDTYMTNSTGAKVPFTPVDGYYEFSWPAEIPPATIYVDPARVVDPALTPCNSFTVNVSIIEATDLYTLWFRLGFNSTILNATGIELGSFFPPDIIPVIHINNTEGYIFFNATLYPIYPDPVSGNGTLATISFHVEGLGPSTLDLYDVSLFNQWSIALPSESLNGYFNNIVLAKLYVNPPEIIDPSLVPPLTFDVNITIDDVEYMYSYQFNLSFAPSILSCLVVTPRDVLNETKYTPEYRVDNIAGFVWVRVTYYVPAEPITSYNPLALVTLTFRVKGPGCTVLDLQKVTIADPTEQTIPSEVEDGFFCPMIRDVAVVNVVPSLAKAYQGWIVDVNVTVRNEGNLTETFDVKAYYNTNLIGTITVENLSPDEEDTITFIWNTQNVEACRNYTINAEADAVPQETDLEDNAFEDGTVKINLLGDTNNDDKVDMQDINIIANAFGSYPRHPRWNFYADLNSDGIVDMVDMRIVCKHFLDIC